MRALLPLAALLAGLFSASAMASNETYTFRLVEGAHILASGQATVPLQKKTHTRLSHEGRYPADPSPTPNLSLASDRNVVTSVNLKLMRFVDVAPTGTDELFLGIEYQDLLGISASANPAGYAYDATADARVDRSFVAQSRLGLHESTSVLLRKSDALFPALYLTVTHDGSTP